MPRPRASHLMLPAMLAVIATSLILAFMYFVNVPMSPDGGWYAYPAYAWANGGDPSENLAGFETVHRTTGNVIAMFGWENRSNLTVPAMGLWFELLPASAASIALLGLLQWLAIAMLASLAVWTVSKDWLMSAFAGLITLSDSRLIAEAISDARPDVPVLLVALGLLVAMLLVAERRGGILAILAAVALAAALPLVHVTSANAIAALSAFLVFRAFDEWRGGVRLPRLAILLLPAAVMCVTFLVRQPILDWLVPTSVPASVEALGQHSLVQKLKEIVASGFTHKLSMEIARWAHQFHPANLAQLIALLSGVAIAVWLVRSVKDDAVRLAFLLAAGVVSGAVVMFAVDPHHTSGHALVLAVVGYSAAAIAVARARIHATLAARYAVPAAVALLLLAAGLKLVHAGIIEARYARAGISTAQLTSALESAITETAAAFPGSAVRIEGASEIWPYLTHRGERIEIVDPDRETFPGSKVRSPDHAARLLVISDDHYKWGWQPILNGWRQAGLITPLREIGRCGETSRCLEIYRIENKSTVGTTGTSQLH
ncbi:MAG: hypothetical protein KDJ47_17125 [Hyphomicrobiaceae bacterium]|nr:hypothetical protein [Hyphomicrobiaceae bacterium]